MAKCRVTVELIEDLVFGAAPNPVRILNVDADYARRALVLEIAGPDVPEADEVIGVMNVQQNRLGQRLVTMTFQKVERAAAAGVDIHVEAERANIVELLTKHRDVIARWVRQQKRNGVFA